VDAGFDSLLYDARTLMRFAGPPVALSETHDDWNLTVRVSRPGEVTNAELIGVILPTLPRDATARVTLHGDRGFDLEALDARVIAALASTARPLLIEGLLSAAGEAAIVVFRADVPSFLLVNGTHLALSHAPLVSAESPVTVWYQRTSTSASLTVAASQSTEVSLSPGMPGAKVVSSDGRDVVTRRVDGQVVFRVPAGTSTYRERGRRARDDWLRLECHILQGMNLRRRRWRPRIR
jgi:hypothetical protein